MQIVLLLNSLPCGNLLKLSSNNEDKNFSWSFCLNRQLGFCDAYLRNLIQLFTMPAAESRHYFTLGQSAHGRAGSRNLALDALSISLAPLFSPWEYWNLLLGVWIDKLFVESVKFSLNLGLFWFQLHKIFRHLLSIVGFEFVTSSPEVFFRIEFLHLLKLIIVFGGHSTRASGARSDRSWLDWTE